MTKNRRAETEARGLLSRADRLTDRAAAHLLGGDALSAMRILRAAEAYNRLDSRLRAKRAADIQARIGGPEAALKERERACDRREALLEHLEQSLREERERLKQAEATLRAAYSLMYEAGAVGPARATGEETDSGVAPL